MLTNPRHEAFAQAMATMDGTPADECYRRHVSNRGTRKTSQEGASRLLADRKIAARIKALKGAVERVADEQFGLTRASWLGHFLAVASKAENSGNFSAAVRSLREIGLAMPGWYAPQEVDASLSYEPPEAVFARARAIGFDVGATLAPS